jgi:hypothetical protein
MVPVTEPLRVFIGVDERQPLAYTVAAHSVQFNSSVPVAVTPLVQSQLPVKRRGLTSFTFTRYLVPWLCGFQGRALFMDADTLAMGDVAELFRLPNTEPVSVVPHGFVMKNGQPVSVLFERPSVMLFDCAQCTKLTPEYIETGKPHSLVEWASSIGHLPADWNYLVGYNTGGKAKLAHFTMGIPCFPETQSDEFAGEWQAIAQRTVSSVEWDQIMGQSVHAQWKRQPAVVDSPAK